MPTEAEAMIRTQRECRLCRATMPHPLIAFPGLPVAGTYVSSSTQDADPVFPLSLVECNRCGLVQRGESLAPSFYVRYQFLSGVAVGYRNHLSGLVRDVSALLPQDAAVLEIGASDGTLLEELRGRGFSVAGFEPAEEPCRLAQGKGLAVVNRFFGPDTVAECPLERVDLVVIRHVMEHMNDFQSLFEGLDRLIHSGTGLLIEVPDLVSTVAQEIYSNIYHLHSSYFDASTMSRLLEQFGWRVRTLRIVDVFGGSLLLWADRCASSGRVLKLDSVSSQEPRALQASALHQFAAHWRERAGETRRFFDRLRAKGMRVAGYGAAERTTALVGMAGLEASHMIAIYDRNPNLDGLRLPGSRIPIRCADRIADDRPECLVIFARSFEAEILRQYAAFGCNGGRFVSTATLPPVFIDGSGVPTP